jgi:hypothetical protein
VQAGNVVNGKQNTEKGGKYCRPQEEHVVSRNMWQTVKVQEGAVNFSGTVGACGKQNTGGKRDKFRT